MAEGKHAGKPVPAAVDSLDFCRYRFHAAPDGPGRGCGPVNVKQKKKKSRLVRFDMEPPQ